MSQPLVPPDPIAGRAGALTAAFICSWTNGGPDAAWVHVAGELDIATTPQLVQTLRESQLQARLVVLDLRELVFMDSSCVPAIVNASIRARRMGGRLVLLRAPPNVDRMFTLTGGSDDVEIGETRTGSAALRSAPATRRRGSRSMSAASGPGTGGDMIPAHQ